jgi:hypothetical protein
MKLKQWISDLKRSCLVTFKWATQQAGMGMFIPGTYERDRKETGFLIVERIIIHSISSVADLYSIRKVICRYTSPEEKTVYEPKAEEWTATYDTATRQLIEIAGNRSLTFLPEESLLLVDKVSYYKIANTRHTTF